MKGTNTVPYDKNNTHKTKFAGTGKVNKAPPFTNIFNPRKLRARAEAMEEVAIDTMVLACTRLFYRAW